MTGTARAVRRSRNVARVLLPAALLLAMLSACAGGPPPETNAQVDASRFPRDAARFELQPVNDSTASFQPAEARWVRAGMVGVAVDPARGDALVGKLRILEIRDGRAEALVTGQTTRLAPGHVLLLVSPHRPWWRQGTFWWGALSGFALAGGVVAFL